MRYRGFEEIPIRVVVRVGSTRLSFTRLSDLAAGQLLVLDRAVGSPFELVAEDHVLGEVTPVAAGDAIALKLAAEEKTDDVPTG